MTIINDAKLSGLIPPVVTPWHQNGEGGRGTFDKSAFDEHMNYFHANGVTGAFILGKTGGFQYLNLEERKEIADHAAANFSGRFQLVVGITGRNLDETLEFSEHLNGNSGIAAVVVAPMINFGAVKPLDYVTKVSQTSQLQIFLYNNPEFTGQDIPFGCIRYLAEQETVSGIKDSSGNIDYLKELISLRSKNFSVFEGSERLIHEVMGQVDGWVAGSANHNSELMAYLWNNRNDFGKIGYSKKLTELGDCLSIYRQEGFMPALHRLMAERKMPGANHVNGELPQRELVQY